MIFFYYYCVEEHFFSTKQNKTKSPVSQDDWQNDPPKPQRSWLFLFLPTDTSILQSRQCGQLPARQPVQTAGWSRRRLSRPFFIQAQLAVWNGQISLYRCRLYICLCRTFVKNDMYSKYNFVFWGRCLVWLFNFWQLALWDNTHKHNDPNSPWSLLLHIWANNQIYIQYKSSIVQRTVCTVTVTVCR